MIPNPGHAANLSNLGTLATVSQPSGGGNLNL
jgi:hypothetical protein